VLDGGPDPLTVQGRGFNAAFARLLLLWPFVVFLVVIGLFRNQILMLFLAMYQQRVLPKVSDNSRDVNCLLEQVSLAWSKRVEIIWCCESVSVNIYLYLQSCVCMFACLLRNHRTLTCCGTVNHANTLGFQLPRPLSQWGGGHPHLLGTSPFPPPGLGMLE